jgi:hypothetical protein
MIHQKGKAPDRPAPRPGPATDAGPGGEGAAASGPWIETKEGGLFFVNAVLVAPEVMVLIPLLLQAFVELVNPAREPSPFLDTIPFVASRALPLVGWFLVIPIWTTVKNLTMVRRLLPRLALAVFLALHLGFLAYTVWSVAG